MVVLDYRDNPVKINIKDKKLRFNKNEAKTLLKYFYQVKGISKPTKIIMLIDNISI